MRQEPNRRPSARLQKQLPRRGPPAGLPLGATRVAPAAPQELSPIIIVWHRWQLAGSCSCHRVLHREGGVKLKVILRYSFFFFLRKCAKVEMPVLGSFVSGHRSPRGRQTCASGTGETIHEFPHLALENVHSCFEAINCVFELHEQALRFR